MRSLWRNCIIAACLTLLVACADTPSSDSDQSAIAGGGAKELSAAFTSNTVPDITEIVHPPATGEYVGALGDVTAHTCEHVGGGWRVTGEVTNSTPAAVDYRVYVSLLNGAAVNRAVVEVEVPAVAPSAVGTFDTLIAIPDADLRCILRVERRAQGT